MAREQTVFFEDFTPGDTAEFGGYRVTEEEIVDFARRYDPQPYHLDREAAKASIFGDLCASGWHTCAMTMRMMVDHMAESGAASLGSPGVDQIRWLKPVYAGDELSVRTEVIETRPLRRRRGLGIVKSSYTVVNQKGEPVMTFIGNGFFARRTSEDNAETEGSAEPEAAS